MNYGLAPTPWQCFDHTVLWIAHLAVRSIAFDDVWQTRCGQVLRQAKSVGARLRDVGICAVCYDKADARERNYITRTPRLVTQSEMENFIGNST